MSAQISASSHDPVRQFSVFAENRVGRLHELTALLKDHNVHIMAITVLDTTDSAIVRVIVDDPDRARELMVNNDFPYSEGEVLAVEITDESDLKGVLAALLEAEINIHYVYSFINGGGDVPPFITVEMSLSLPGFRGVAAIASLTTSTGNLENSGFETLALGEMLDLTVHVTVL